MSTLRASVVALILAANVTLFVSPAFSGNLARVSASTSSASGKWGAVVRLWGSTITSGQTPVSFTWTNGTRNTTLFRYVELLNVGTFSLSSVALSAPVGTWSGGGTLSTLRYRTCSAAWSGNACSGAMTTLGTVSNPRTTATAFTYTSALAVATPMMIQISMTSSASGTFTLTPATSVSRSSVRAAAVTQS